MFIGRFDGFWFDERNNKWDATRYSLEEVVRLYDSLINCSNCIDCKNCKGCSNCNHCDDCNDCYNCTYCEDCTGCRNCRSCTYCYGCKDCTGCRNCRSCTNCTDCKDCIGCDSFSKNPERLVGPVLGPRDDMPIVYWVEVGKEQCLINCIFHGTLNELEKVIEEKYKDNYELLTQYRKFIKVVRDYQRITK